MPKWPSIPQCSHRTRQRIRSSSIWRDWATSARPPAVEDEPLTWEAWFCLGVVIVVLISLVRDVVAPAVAMAGGMVAVLVAGIVTPGEALSGFSNPAPLTVAALFILARAVEKTGALTPIVQATLGKNGSVRGSLTRLVLPTTAASAFLNNTPIVAMLLPQVRAWAEARGRSPSLYLMPLSFAALLGGVVTVIGTSTNLVVSGLLEAAGEPPIGFFEITWVGLPIAIVGGVVLVFLTPNSCLSGGPCAKKQKTRPASSLSTWSSRKPDRSTDERSKRAGLRHLSGSFLATLEREGELVAPVSPDMVLKTGDRLRFIGKSDDVMDLQTTRGLKSAEAGHLLSIETDQARYFEAVIGADFASGWAHASGRRLPQPVSGGGVGHPSGRAANRRQARSGRTTSRGHSPPRGGRQGSSSDGAIGATSFWFPGSKTAPPRANKNAWLVGAVTLGIVLGASLDLVADPQCQPAGCLCARRASRF